MRLLIALLCGASLTLSALFPNADARVTPEPVLLTPQPAFLGVTETAPVTATWDRVHWHTSTDVEQVPGFDTSLGALQYVKIRFRPSIFTRIGVEASYGTTISATVDVQPAEATVSIGGVDLDTVGGNTTASAQAQGPFDGNNDCAGSSGQTVTVQDNFDGGWIQTTDPAVLAAVSSGPLAEVVKVCEPAVAIVNSSGSGLTKPRLALSASCDVVYGYQ